MGMTLAEKILAAHSGRSEVSPGELINVKVDLVMANDVTAPIAIRQFERLGVADVWDKQRVALAAPKTRIVSVIDIRILTKAAQIRRNYQTNFSAIVTVHPSFPRRHGALTSCPSMTTDTQPAVSEGPPTWA